MIQDIVDRILSDARSEAERIVAAAEEEAEKIRKDALAEAKRLQSENEAETKQKCDSIADGKAATARLDCQKVLLAEKRRVITTLYRRALDRLLAMDAKESLALCNRLLETYAAEGDKVVLSANARYLADVKKLPVVSERHLSVVSGNVEGGILICGKKADIDLSYTALLAADREERQAEIAKKLFE